MSVFDRFTGDRDPVVVRDELIALKEPERRRRAKAAQREIDKLALPGTRGHLSKRWRVAALEWVGTATARRIITDFWTIGFELRTNAQFADDVYAVLSARGHAFFEALARGLLRAEIGATGWPLVRRAVRDGVISQPDGEEYLRRLVTSVGTQGRIDRLDATYAALLVDPELLDDDVWQVFEIDVGSELSNATTWNPRSEDEPWAGIVRGDNRWLYALTRLAHEGRLDRDRLLDASVDALLRDFRPSTVGWYARLHEALEPDRDERIARLDRYLALVTSPVPAVAKEGLAALRQVDDAVPPEAFARVTPSPLSQRQKNLSIETLALLSRLAKRHPDARPVLLEAAVQALGHDRTDVQERALKLLERHPDAVPRAALLGYVDVVSPTLRVRVETLTGVAAPRPAPEPIVIPTSRAEQPQQTSAGLVVLDPVATVDELIELAAMLVEGQGNGDDCECFLDGVSRLCDQRPAGFERRTAGLAKRAESAAYWGLDVSGAELVAHVVRAWTRRHEPLETVDGGARTIMGFLVGRAEEVARRAARRNARPLLAFPTYNGGSIEPAELEARLARTGRFRNRADPLDRTQAHARAFVPAGPLTFERRVLTTTSWNSTTRRLRLFAPDAPAGLGELGIVATRAGAVEEGSRTWYGAAAAWAGFDALAGRWALTVLPSFPEVAFAGSATVAVEAREASDASAGHPDAVLERALERPVPLPPVAWLAIAACLVMKSPRVRRVAVDLLVASVDDGRSDAHALGQEIAWLVENDFAKVSRLEAPLRDLARVSPTHAAQAMRSIESVLAELGSRPHALHVLLDVAVECAASTGQRIESERARTFLARVAAEGSPSSKLSRLARSLVDG